MEYVSLGLGALAVVEGIGLWFLWTRWRTAQSRVSAAEGASDAALAALHTAYDEAAAARAALAKQNDLEAKADAQVVAAAPGLDDALSRINGLR